MTGVEHGGHRAGRARARARVRRSARPPPHAGTRGRGDDRLGHRRRRRGRLLRDRRDAEHRPGRRHGIRAARPPRAGAGGGGDPDGLHGRDLEGPAWGGAHRDGRARRGRCARVHRRRAPRCLGRPDATGALLQRRRGPAARAPLRGAVALRGRPHARGRRLRAARARGLALGRGEPDGRARPGTRGLRGPSDPPAASLGARVGRGRAPRPARRASR